MSAQQPNDEVEQLRRQLDKSNAQLQSVRKELESFSYTVSHDLRAPLRAIEGYTQILEEDFNEKLGDEGKRIIGVITKNSRRMTQMIDDLLTYSRITRQALTPATLDMSSMAGAIAADLKNNFAHPERVSIDIAQLLPAKGDMLMLRQVWTQLLGNAIKFSSKNDTLRITVRSKTEQERVVYEVRDNGIGFDMRYYDKLFGVFQRLHSSNEYDGAGIGLALVQRMLMMNDGKIWAEAEPGTGAAFYFSLPKAE